MGLGLGDEWKDWSVAFAVLYLPVLGILALGQLLWRRRLLRS